MGVGGKRFSMGANRETERRVGHDQSSHLSPGTIFTLLSRDRRRIALEVLIEHREVCMADLAEAVAIREHDVDFEDLSEDEILKTYIDLWHTHVPKLVEGGVAEYDQERDLVHLDPAADEIEGFIF